MGQVHHGSHNDRGDPSSGTAWSREPERFRQALRDQPQDRGQVEEAFVRRRPAHRSPGAQVNGPVGRGRGRRRCLPPSHAVAARRLPLRPPAQHAAPLTRSSLHRCLQRHGISRLPDTEGDKPSRSKFKRYPIGYFHIDIAEVRTEQGKLHLFVAIDRTSKFAFAELHEKATRRVAANLLRAPAAAVPSRIHTVLTDNGTHFTEPTGDGWTPEDIRRMMARNEPFLCHAFEFACAELNVEHRLTKPRHPWTNGQVERMNRTIQDATVKRFYYESHEQLRQHLADFVAAYNFARRLKTLRGLTPYEAICKTWTEEPSRFIHDPYHQIPGPNI